MSDKTHTTAVVLIPSESIQSPIQNIRKKHDRNYIRWMPHITLLYPFAPQDKFQEVIPLLSAAAQQTLPFTVTLTSFNAFHHRKSCTLFLIPEPKNNVVNLHGKLIQHLPDYDDTARFSGGFNPHLSVGQFQHRDINDAKQRLQNEWKPIKYEVDSISLIYRSRETNDRFVVAENFYFNKGVNN
ncbi:MAG: 2'-5' RNA ligase family protein [Candidatus Poribacteria bacterium]|nr:2'-5' RNA ligase family protein [Candidatus Poribacteria bacterium]